MSVYKVSKEELDNIPIASKEFLDACKIVGEKYKKKYENIEDCLVVGVDFDSRTNHGVVTVGRHQDGKLYIINVLENEEAREIYDKLIGL